LSHFVISLDFELFWGVSDVHTIGSYGKNIEGSLTAIPRLLRLFRRYQIHATWATVGMVMCRDLSQWQQIRPSTHPAYTRTKCSTYSAAALASEYPDLFFARPLVEQILATPDQELATHTYSHFYCGEHGATPEQFAADLACANQIGAELGVKYRSIVFPRNQVKKEYLPELSNAGIAVFRGNPEHWLYADGHCTPGGIAGRAVRFADTWVDLTGKHVGFPARQGGAVNLPASMFFRPWSRRLQHLEGLRLRRLKNGMSAAAHSGGVFHLWWHPHNFGLEAERNLETLELVLQHYQYLHDTLGMQSVCMGDFSSAEGA
jgi:peptidoglycan/xylan/chitin deacetylase (PgdA/CDA1 family)